MKPAEIEAYVDAASAVLGLALRPEHRPGVLRYFALAAEQAALLEAVPLAMHVEPAPSFVPVSPREREA
ncbi:conserved hypothetical protein [Burkholderiales bacterium 8X]|nr:conserved hypothetical protein [Burkholderiales bacterium 8X]